jgi:hypothetical protein
MTYVKLKSTVLGLGNDALSAASYHAFSEDERRELIDLCADHVTFNVWLATTTKEQAFTMIDEIAAKLKRDLEQLDETASRDE